MWCELRSSQSSLNSRLFGVDVSTQFTILITRFQHDYNMEGALSTKGESVYETLDIAGGC